MHLLDDNIVILLITSFVLPLIMVMAFFHLHFFPSKYGNKRKKKSDILAPNDEVPLFQLDR